MPKLNITKAQIIIEALGLKIEELQNKIVRMESKKKCPFWYHFSVKTCIDTCIYMGANHLCENLAKCLGNNDAWCYKQILAGIEEKEDFEIIADLKKILKKYADIRCEGCTILLSTHKDL